MADLWAENFQVSANGVLRQLYATMHTALTNAPVSQWEIDRIDTRGTVTVGVFDQEQYDGDWVPESLIDAVAWLQAKLESIPVEHRRTAKIEIDSVSSYEDSHYAHIGIDYQRPETDEEWAARRADVERRLAAQSALAEVREKAGFELLKAKFGSPTNPEPS